MRPAVFAQLATLAYLYFATISAARPSRIVPAAMAAMTWAACGSRKLGNQFIISPNAQTPALIGIKHFQEKRKPVPPGIARSWSGIPIQ